MMIDYTGQQIGNYRLVRQLGIGGFASVYLGQHIHIATRQVAIKILHLSDVDTQKFQHEAATMASLDHPHILRLIDFSFFNAIPFLVMDYAPGGSLRTRHPHGTQLPLATVVEYLTVLAGAVQYAHNHNIIHRDLKPENILIGTHQELRLSDFGIAVLSQTGRTTLNPAYGTGGTPFYMAPEQCRGKPEKASDQYALAIMAYEWLCGTPPFTEGNAINIQFQHTYEPVPSLREKLPTFPEAVEHVIFTALAKDPKQRFATVQAFATALEQANQFAASQITPASPAATPNPPGLGDIRAALAISTVEAQTGTTRMLTLPGGRQVRISVPAGIQSGDVVRLDGQGEVHPAGGPSGALVLTITVKTEQETPVTPLSLSVEPMVLSEPFLAQAQRAEEEQARKDREEQAHRVEEEQLKTVEEEEVRKALEESEEKQTRKPHQPSRRTIIAAGATGAVILISGSVIAFISFAQHQTSGSTPTPFPLGTLLLRYTGHSASVNSVAWSPDGKRLASASYDKTVQVWSAG